MFCSNRSGVRFEHEGASCGAEGDEEKLRVGSHPGLSFAINTVLRRCGPRFSRADVATAVPDSRPGLLPGMDEDTSYSIGNSEHLVIVYDHDTITFDAVISILMQATACTLEEAQIETWEVHHLGKSVVHHGSEGECNRAAQIIRTIGLRVEVIEG